LRDEIEMLFLLELEGFRYINGTYDKTCE